MSETMRDRLIDAIGRTNWRAKDGAIDLWLIADAVLAEMERGPDTEMRMAGCESYGYSLYSVTKDKMSLVTSSRDTDAAFVAMIRAARASPRRHDEIDERRQAEQQHPEGRDDNP